jgi:hypothetical protein
MRRWNELERSRRVPLRLLILVAAIILFLMYLSALRSFSTAIGIPRIVNQGRVESERVDDRRDADKKRPSKDPQPTLAHVDVPAEHRDQDKGRPKTDQQRGSTPSPSLIPPTSKKKQTKPPRSDEVEQPKHRRGTPLLVEPWDDLKSWTSPSEWPEFRNVFTSPRNLQLESEHQLSSRGEPVTTVSPGNKLLALYDDVSVPSAEEAGKKQKSKSGVKGFEVFSGDLADFWKEHYPPELVVLLKKFIVLNQQMEAGTQEKRYVTVRPVGQLCNRLVAISSGFVMALLTKRGLQFEDDDFYASLDQDLFDNPGWKWVGHGYDYSDGATIQNPESGVWPDTEPLLCADYATHYSQRNIHFAINQYLVPYMTSNPHYHKDLMELFNGPQLFPAVIRFLFRPRKQILKQRDDFVRKHFANRYVIGLQVRSGGDFTDHFMSEHDWQLYRECALAATPETNRSNVLFFVATDTEKGREAAKRYLGAGGKTEVIFGPSPFLLSNNPKGVQMALLDLLLLGSANDRVNTAWSSYGYFSAGLGGVPVNLVTDRVDKSLWVAPPGQEQRFMGVPHKSDRRVQCVRLRTVEPCFHKYASWGAVEASCFKKEFFEREMLNGRYC